MSTFIKSLGEAIGYSAMNADTEVCVYTENEFCIAIPDCCTDLEEGGILMTAIELQDALFTSQLSDSGEYEEHFNADRFEFVDAGMVVLRNVSAFNMA